MIEWQLPLKLKSPNVQGHWSQRYARDRSNKMQIVLAWKIAKQRPKAPCIVHIQRIYSGKEKNMDFDNFVGSLKGTRDAIANLLIPGLAPGQADDEKRGITWVYEQTKGNKSEVKISFEAKK